jgi:hypothetical protein
MAFVKGCLLMTLRVDEACMESVCQDFQSKRSLFFFLFFNILFFCVVVFSVSVSLLLIRRMFLSSFIMNLRPNNNKATQKKNV